AATACLAFPIAGIPFRLLLRPSYSGRQEPPGQGPPGLFLQYRGPKSEDGSGPKPSCGLKLLGVIEAGGECYTKQIVPPPNHPARPLDASGTCQQEGEPIWDWYARLEPEPTAALRDIQQRTRKQWAVLTGADLPRNGGAEADALASLDKYTGAHGGL